jgi:hypothetical protein
MNDDVRAYTYGTLIVFVIGLFVWIGFLYVNACGFTLTCHRGVRPVERTPIPTLIPATLPAMQPATDETAVPDTCRLAAADLVGAWVDAGYSETEPFQFTDLNGQNCEATFADVKPLFVDANLWYPGSLSCVSCHSVDLAVSPAQLDLSSYAGILAGSRRADADSKGTDILAAGNWGASLLREFIAASHADIPGHSEPISALVIFAGQPAPPEAEATPTP